MLHRNSRFTTRPDPQPRSQQRHKRQNAIGCFRNERLDHHPVRIARRAIHQIDGLRPLASAVSSQPPAKLKRRPGTVPTSPSISAPFTCASKFRLMAVRSTISRNLIVFVIVVEDIAVQRQRAIEQRVFRAEFEGIDEFRLERQRMNRDLPTDCLPLNDRKDRARRIGAAGLVAMRVGPIDQSLIGEIELRRPVDGGAARELVPLLVHDAGDGVAIAGHKTRSGYRRNASGLRSSASPPSASDLAQCCNRPRRNRHRNSTCRDSGSENNCVLRC